MHFFVCGDDIGDDFCDTGSVKKAVSAIRIIHDRSKCNDSSVEEYQSALSHTREPRAAINSDTLDPLQVLSLFRSMHDEVDLYIYVDVVFFFWV